MRISVGDPKNYFKVDASVRIGDLSGGPFKVDGSFLSHSVNWSGTGRHTLRARLGAGDLKLE